VSDSDHLVFSVDGGPTAAAAARRAIRGQNGWIPDAVREGVLLLVTELVTNAVRHGEVGGDQPVRVGVHRQDGCLRVEVLDAGPGFEPATPRPAGTGGGWGLYFVECFSSRWGISPEPTGTCVWFEIESPEGATDPREARAPAAASEERPSPSSGAP
jgi:anti-sigma regulatory factor (Ser/Thr protein kinase)